MLPSRVRLRPPRLLLELVPRAPRPAYPPLPRGADMLARVCAGCGHAPVFGAGRASVSAVRWRRMVGGCAGAGRVGAGVDYGCAGWTKKRREQVQLVTNRGPAAVALLALAHAVSHTPLLRHEHHVSRKSISPLALVESLDSCNSTEMFCE